MIFLYCIIIASSLQKAIDKALIAQKYLLFRSRTEI